MHFIHYQKDDALRAALVAHEVVNDGLLAELVGRVRNESGHLFEDVLMPFCSELDGNRWLYWLVSKHRLHRLNNPKVTAEFIESEHFDPKTCEGFSKWQTYPIGRAPGGKRLLVAVARPDYLADAMPSLGEAPILLAATPSEVSAIFRVYRSYL